MNATAVTATSEWNTRAAGVKAPCATRPPPPNRVSRVEVSADGVSSV
jgi:hypothetical protein